MEEVHYNTRSYDISKKFIRKIINKYECLKKAILVDYNSITCFLKTEEISTDIYGRIIYNWRTNNSNLQTIRSNYENSFRKMVKTDIEYHKKNNSKENFDIIIDFINFIIYIHKKNYNFRETAFQNEIKEWYDNLENIYNSVQIILPMEDDSTYFEIFDNEETSESYLNNDNEETSESYLNNDLDENNLWVEISKSLDNNGFKENPPVLKLEDLQTFDKKVNNNPSPTHISQIFF